MEGARWPKMLRKLLRTLADRMLPPPCATGRRLVACWPDDEGCWTRNVCTAVRRVLARRRARCRREFFVGGGAAVAGRRSGESPAMS
ncbi:hypothetical protein F511_47574 [Dorcoceras hygrometricum]|uniref:Uncharacterized protein n=1 Tax=Dorcoceras hygrometricum TaxID=472368 RepID=A0A2Z6ZRP0_9LAMI|nr:hypothetical protein F511_47574 [Dorcoceras hygrometricum]